MKFITTTTLIFALAISISSSQITTSIIDNKPNTKEVKMDNEYPKYEITVTQNGTELGKILIETFPDKAPKHSANFDSLVSIGFYDGTVFHRVIPGFMIQGGDPNSKNSPDDRTLWGTGDRTQTRVPAEFNKGLENWTHKRGILSAARSNDPNSATSQFFIMHADAPHLDGQYSIYGQVLSGMEVVDAIATTPKNGQDQPNNNITMKIVKVSK
ncbi:MAG: peptidylprolyl isomerase [Ignavibacteria bacterium]|jgi:cyclophilin family peptidyl-prolyl cis-trans isomerase|nr:peptidylprolyl isomerase [Ignavibacteria bacterium]